MKPKIYGKRKKAYLVKVALWILEQESCGWPRSRLIAETIGKSHYDIQWGDVEKAIKMEGDK